jgi:hypothetical protein
MLYPIDLTEAARTLVARCGPHLAASRRGGRQHFVTVLRQHFNLAEADASRIISVLEQRQALRWVSAHTPLQPCPAVLELSGTWQIQPQRLQGHTGRDRNHRSSP